ncbi:hypothetical protein [Allomuricauda sp. NBRC 101325]|uniref:hypothetical protein n=1 Tax=Allomuricauda sp. NBRC 101325 TaxID=1113758 RepID=UPI0024A2A457|nr:hypothetical protein [Muricauda sp. NBRC 101325]GLU42958.1 hypothetical protein Musp01_05820 [Muricauda sp. NBRC 101325]
MRKLLVLMMITSYLLGCKKTETVTETAQNDDLEFNYQKMPSKATINLNAAAIVENWGEFNALNSSIDVLYKATNNEDLALAIDDLIEKEKNLEKGKYPELFDSFQVKSRQQVLRTYMYKVKASILENQPTTEPTVQLLEAYNALRKQLNVIMNSQLDKKIILDEI